MGTLLGELTVREPQTRITETEARAALHKVVGMTTVHAIAVLRFGPGQTYEAIARVIEKGASRAQRSGLEPDKLIVAGGRIDAGEDIVRVRRKAHGKADWISSPTSEVEIELQPLGLYRSGESNEPTGAGSEAVPAVPATVPSAGDPNHPLAAAVRECLFEVIDPDLGINVVDLGFVRSVAIEDDTAIITMTLTSAACPLENVMADQVRTELLEREGGPVVSDFRIDWVWIPSWTPAEITPDGLAMLRAIGFTL